MRENECLTLKDIGLTQYELMNGSCQWEPSVIWIWDKKRNIRYLWDRKEGTPARWYWDPHYIPPGRQEDTPLDETILKDIDRALDTRIHYRKKQYRKRWRSMKHN